MMPRKEPDEEPVPPDGWTRDAAQLADLQDRIGRITRLLLDGNGLYTLLDAMENVLRNPVAVVCGQGEAYLSSSLRQSDPSAVHVQALLQTLSFRDADGGAGGRYTDAGGKYRIYITAIPAKRKNAAVLALVGLNKEIVPADAGCADRMAPLTGLELANWEAVREVEGKYVDQFLQDWLTGKIVTDADWKLRADVCGCSVSEAGLLCAVMVGWETKAPAREALREAARRLRSERLHSAEGLLASPVGEDLALIVTLPPSSGGDGNHAAESILKRLHAEMKPLLREGDFRLYAGRPVTRREELDSSWTQAGRTRQVADICGLEGSVLLYDRLGVYSLLYLIPAGEEREQFLLRYSQPLQLADRKGGGRLLETLEMFFRCNGNIKLTSAKLQAHYNTVVYRLEKIQQILDVSLDEPEDRLQLQLALKLGQITQSPAD